MRREVASCCVVSRRICRGLVLLLNVRSALLSHGLLAVLASARLLTCGHVVAATSASPEVWIRVRSGSTTPTCSGESLVCVSACCEARGRARCADEGVRRCRKTKIATRKNEIVNRLEKTKKWEDTDLEAEHIRRKKEESAEKAREAEKARIEREAQEKKWKEEKEARSYDKLYDEANCTRAGEMELDSDGEPDFM